MANETLDPGNQSEGDTKEGIYIGQEIPADSEDAKLPLHGPNQWPREVFGPPPSTALTSHSVGGSTPEIGSMFVQGICLAC